MTASRNPLFSLRTLLILMALLTGLTWWIGTSISRYTVETSAVTQSFPGDISQWKLVENWKQVEQLPGFELLDNGIKVTRTSKGISDAELRVALPSHPTPGAKLLASAELYAQAISGGEKNWHGLLYTIWFYDNNGDRIKKSARSVQALRGDTVPLTYSREIDLPAQAVEVGIGLRVFESTGTAVMRAPSIQVVTPWAGYSQVILGVLAMWLVYGALVLVALALRGRLMIAIFPIAMIGIIAAGVSLPTEELSRFTGPLEQAIRGYMPDLRKFGLYSFNKVGHAVTFALLTFMACFFRKRLGATWLGMICFLILLAILTEGVQLFFVGRSTRLVDMAIDLSGATLGAALFFVFWVLSSPFRRR